jgi:hypothetical protein
MSKFGKFTDRGVKLFRKEKFLSFVAEYIQDVYVFTICRQAKKYTKPAK